MAEFVGSDLPENEACTIKAEWVALLASGLMAVGYLMQMVHVHQTGNVSSFSVATILANILGSLLWVGFGWLNGITANVVTGIIYTIFNLYYLTYFL